MFVRHGAAEFVTLWDVTRMGNYKNNVKQYGYLLALINVEVGS